MKQYEAINDKEFEILGNAADNILEIHAEIRGELDIRGDRELKIGDVLKYITLLKQVKDQAKEIKTAAENLWTSLTIGVIPDFMEEQELSTISGEDHRMEVRNQLRVNVLKENRAALHSWLRENGFKEMVVEGVNSSTLKSMVKTGLDEGTNFPAHLVNIDTFKQAVLVKK